MKKTIAIILSIMLVMAITFPVAAIPQVAVKSIKLDNSKITVKIGQTSRFKATLSPANTTQKQLTYVSSNLKVAKVDVTGKIIGVSTGTTTITVNTLDKKIFAKCEVTVSKEMVKPMTLQLYTHSNEPLEKAWNAMVTKYHTAFPNITVKYNVIPSDTFITKLPILFASKQSVDIINIHDRYIAPFLPQLATAPAYVQNDIVTNCPSSYRLGMMGGNIYGYLYPVSHIAFVNKTMFKEAGLSYPKTWDELVSDNKIMTKTVKVDGKDVQKVGVNFWWGAGQGMFTTAYWNQIYASIGGVLLPPSGGKIEINNSLAIKATEMFKQLSNRDGMFLNDFAAGNVGYIIGASWCTPFFKSNGVKGLDFGIINVPNASIGRPIAQGYFQMVVVPNWRPKEIQDAAWEFNLWAHNDENNYLLETLGGVGDWRLDTIKRLGSADPNVKAAYDAAPFASSPLIHAKWADIERIICDWVEKCVYDKVSAADAMAGAQAELNKTLKQ